MSYNILVYADNKFYLLSSKTYNLIKIIDENTYSADKLQDIIPQSIRSFATYHFIVDIFGRCFLVTFEGYDSNKVRCVCTNIHNFTFTKLQIVGCEVIEHDCIKYCSMLVKNLDDTNKDQSYEHLTFQCKFNNCVHKDSTILNDSNVTYRVGTISVAYKSQSHGFNNFDWKYIMMNPDFSHIEKVHYTVDSTGSVSDQKHKYMAHVCKKLCNNKFNFRYSIQITNNDECHTITEDGNSNKVCTVTEGSRVLYNGHCINILTGNNIVAIVDNGNIISSKLSCTTVYHLGNNQVNDLVFSKPLYRKLPCTYKEAIKGFMMYNMRKKTFKIPYCVLQIIFNHMIN